MHNISFLRQFFTFKFSSVQSISSGRRLADIFRSCASMKFVNFLRRSNIFNPERTISDRGGGVRTIDNLLPPFCHCQSLLTGLHDYRATVTTVNQWHSVTCRSIFAISRYRFLDSKRFWRRQVTVCHFEMNFELSSAKIMASNLEASTRISGEQRSEFSYYRVWMRRLLLDYGFLWK